MSTEQNFETAISLLDSQKLSEEEKAAIIALLKHWEEDSGILMRYGIELPEI